MNEPLSCLPVMLTGEELRQKLLTLPPVRSDIRSTPAPERLVALNAVYELYFPFPMSGEIYTKLYLALARSLQKKNTRLSVIQCNNNRKAILGAGCSGLIGGADSFTILGRSGIGKSTAVARAVNLMRGGEIITVKDPFCKIIPVLVVQCPWDSSVKGMLLEILRKTDEHLQTKYYENALRARLTTDNLIGSVSTVCLNHVGLLIIDEIQNVASSKNGRSLIGSMTQLINASGISIAMVGTPESTPFFEQDYKLARRSLGLKYDAIPLDEDFVSLCKVLFQYQVVKKCASLTDSIVRWFYDHSGGITSNVVSLIHDAQEIAILDGTEELSLDVLNRAYRQRMGFLHQYIDSPTLSNPTIKEPTSITVPEETPVAVEPTVLAAAVAESKHSDRSIVSLLQGRVTIVEVPL